MILHKGLLVLDQHTANRVLAAEVLVPPVHVVAGVSSVGKDVAYISLFVRSSSLSSGWSMGVSMSGVSG